MKRGGRVVSEYLGRGEDASLSAALDAADRDQREAEAADRRAARRREAEADARLDGLLREVHEAAARLAVLGYHRHKRQWRRRRGGREG